MKTIIFNKKLYKNDIKKIINWFVKNYGAIRTNKLVDNLKTLGFNTATEFGISLGIHDLKSPDIKKKLLQKAEKNIKNQKEKYITSKINLISYLSKKNEIWNQTNNLLTDEITKNYEQKELLNPAYVMIISGARGNLSQIKQLVGMRGLMADAQGEIISTPIKKNLLEGIELAEFFISCYGARKGIIDTALKTANSGYLTRKLIFAVQEEIIKQPNCNTKSYIIVKNDNLNKKNFSKLKNNIFGRIIAKTIKIITNGKKINLNSGQDICNYLFKKLVLAKKIQIRTPLTCKLNNGLCQMCYGWNLGNGRMVALGETVGIIAAQSIGEPGTQLTMRTFHTGGVVNIKTNETIISPSSGIISYNMKKIGKRVETNNKGKVFITLKNGKITILPNKGNKLSIKIPKYSIIYVNNKEKVHRKQILSEKMYWKNLKNSRKKLTVTIKSNISGLIEEKKLNNNKKKIIEIIIGNIINSKDLNNSLKKKDGKNFTILFKNTKGIIKESKQNQQLKNTNKNKSKQKIVDNLVKKYVDNKTYIVKNNKKLTVVNKIRTTLIITKNLDKRLGKLIKIRYIKSKEEIKCSKIVEKTKIGITITKSNTYKKENNTEKWISDNQQIKKNQAILFLKFEKGKIADIIEGLPKIQQILEANKKQMINEKLRKNFIKLKKKYKYKKATKKSILHIQKYLLKKLQKVYINQGINITNKHFEVIIKQMTSKVVIKKEGESKLINGEIINLNKVEKINENIKEKVIYEPIVLGISKLIKLKEGFLCSASFQETTKVLSKAAIEGKIDWLNGLKENIILGTIIPAGTGFKK